MVPGYDSSDQLFRRYGSVEAIQELDPIGALGLMAPYFKVCCNSIFVIFPIFVYIIFSFVYMALLVKVIFCSFSFRSRIGPPAKGTPKNCLSFSWFSLTIRLPSRWTRIRASRPAVEARSTSDEMSVWSSGSKRQDLTASAKNHQSQGPGRSAKDKGNRDKGNNSKPKNWFRFF